MPSIETRIAALSAALQRRQMEQAAPVDPLSASLWALGAELAALDEAGLAAEAEALGITPDDVRDMARIYSK